MHEAVKQGINFFDVSPYYGRTRAEKVLGKALRSLPRDSFVVSTKVGRYDTATFDFSAERVTRSVEESMTRLGVDCLDVVQCHDVEFGDLDVVARETIPALAKLKAQGKIRAIGITGYPLEVFPYLLSCVEPGTVDVALSYCNYTLQNSRLANILPWLQRQRVGVINASPLCMGLLTNGGGPDWHPASSAVKTASREAAKLCAERGADLATVAIQYALQADPSLIASTLVGIDSRETLVKNIKVMSTVPDEDLIRDVQAVFNEVKNEKWSSGRFGA